MPFAEQVLFPIFVRQGRSRTRYKVGYIHRDGKTAIEPEFDDGIWFSEGLAAVKSGSTWGFINQEGQIVIEPRLAGPSYFYQGLAAARQHTRGCGFIDRKGKFRIPGRYQVVGAFSEGLAWVRKQEGEEGFINRQGREVVPPMYKSVRGYSEGLAPVQTAKNLWGYIDRSGKVVIRPKFDGDVASSFSEGLGRVNHLGKYGFIDKTGRWVIRPRFPLAFDFSEGWAVVGKSLYEKTGYVNHEGDLGIRLPGCIFALDFSEGLAAVKFQGGSIGFINTEGEYAISPRFESVRPFCSGLALVTTEKSIGYIDRTGEFVWEGHWVETGFFIHPLPLASSGPLDPST